MKCDKRLVLGILGCFGGLFIHLVIGSLYQWGIVNLYITSYYRTLDPAVTLESNAIVFPVIMLCIGLTMRLGLWLTEICIHPIIVMSCVVVLQALFVFVSSFLHSMGSFIVIYGVLFGLASGFNFMIPVVQCNKYFPGKKMYVNGVVLTGTGLGSLVFGLFSYNYLNPKKIPPHLGYYIGNDQLTAIAEKVPEWLKWLSLLYLICGMIGVILISYVCIQNRRKNKQQTKDGSNSQSKEKGELKNDGIPPSSEIIFNESQSQQIKNSEIFESKDILGRMQKIQKIQKIQKKQNNENTLQGIPQTIKQSFCSKVWWLCVVITFFGTCGLFLMNGNYKTYVKASISDDQMLTIIGVMNALGNGFSRYNIYDIYFFGIYYSTKPVINWQWYQTTLSKQSYSFHQDLQQHQLVVIYFVYLQLDVVWVDIQQ